MRAPPTTTEEARPLRVLVVDDEALIGLAVVRVLRQHRVTAVTSGYMALGLLAAGEDFDVVLSDLEMPGMSGIALYRSLVARHPHIAPRVVFITGSSFAPEARAFLGQVANGRLDKPFNAQQLREAIEQAASTGRP